MSGFENKLLANVDGEKHMYNWQYGAFERSLANDVDIAKFRFWLVTVDCRFIRLNVFWLVTVDFK